MKLAAAREIAGMRGWLSRTPEPFRKAVLERTVLQIFEAGQTIYLAGDPPGGAHGLVSGGLRVSISRHEDGPYIAHFFRPGAWFGETAGITAQPRLVSLSASRRTVMLHLPLHAVKEILATQPDAVRLFFLSTQMHLETALGAVADLMIRDQTKRFIAVLLRLGACRVATPTDGLPIEIDLSQEDLGAMANVARTSSNRILKDLAAQGLIEHAYRRIRLRQPDRLRAMLEE